MFHTPVHCVSRVLPRRISAVPRIHTPTTRVSRLDRRQILTKQKTLLTLPQHLKSRVNIQKFKEVGGKLVVFGRVTVMIVAEAALIALLLSANPYTIFPIFWYYCNKED